MIINLEETDEGYIVTSKDSSYVGKGIQPWDALRDFAIELEKTTSRTNNTGSIIMETRQLDKLSYRLTISDEQTMFEARITIEELLQMANTMAGAIKYTNTRSVIGKTE